MVKKRGFLRRAAIFAAGAVASAAIVSSAGCTSPPTKRSMAVRKYVGQYLAWPYEHTIADPFVSRKATRLPESRESLDAAVARAAATIDRQRPDETQATTTILTLRGTPYEMGYEYGTLLRDEVQENVRSMMTQVYRLAWPRQLDAAWGRVSPYISKEFQEELRGLADGAGVKLRTLQELHAVPEITEGSCSGWAILHGASEDGSSWHIRILDFATSFGMQNHPVVLIHDLRDESGERIGNRTITFGWAGYDWSVGGLNDKGLAIGEISGGKADAIAAERWEGVPMGALIRKTLEESDTVAQAEETIKEAHRNHRYAYVLSDGYSAEKILSGYEFFRVIKAGEAQEPLGSGYDAFPGFCDLVYHGANHTKHIARFTEKHDQLGFPDIIEHARTVALRKNLQIWIYHRETNEVWIGNAVGKKRAVDQPLLHINLNDYLK